MRSLDLKASLTQRRTRPNHPGGGEPLESCSEWRGGGLGGERWSPALSADEEEEVSGGVSASRWWWRRRSGGAE